MRTVSIFRNNQNQAVRLPKEYEFPGVTQFTIERQPDALILRPVRPDWRSFFEAPLPEGVDDFLSEREPVWVDRDVFVDEPG